VAIYPDGYSTHEPAFSCPWDGCERRTDDPDEIEAHIRWHDFEMGFNPEVDD
jgi:hypothetical protein